MIKTFTCQFEPCGKVFEKDMRGRSQYNPPTYCPDCVRCKVHWSSKCRNKRLKELGLLDSVPKSMHYYRDELKRLEKE